MKSPRHKLKLAKMPLYYQVELEKNEPLEEERVFVIRSKTAVFSGPAKSCEEFRQKLEAFVNELNKTREGIQIQLYEVTHQGDPAAYNEGEC